MAKNNLTLREQRSLELKQKIYKVSMNLFEKRGYKNVKVSDICDAANISTGTFYYYFNSKEQVFLAYSDVADDYFEKAASKIKGGSAAETLHKLVQRKIEMSVGTGVDVLQHGFIAELNAHYNGSFNIERKAYKVFQSVIEEGIASGEFRADVDPATVVSLMRYWIGGMTLHWCIEEGGFDPYAVADELMDVVLKHLV